jgi:hypothetical protein
VAVVWEDKGDPGYDLLAAVLKQAADGGPVQRHLKLYERVMTLLDQAKKVDALRPIQGPSGRKSDVEQGPPYWWRAHSLGIARPHIAFLFGTDDDYLADVGIPLPQPG